MSFKDTFCSSPWIHLRITSNGDYEYCRWAAPYSLGSQQNISHVYPLEWFQKNMSGIRQDMLSGKSIPSCNRCATMERHGKVSGRQKQLLKIGVTVNDFEKTMLSSPWFPEWKKTHDNNGQIDLYPQDWQIDLGNFCNSACVFCSPRSSSRLASEHYKLGLISSMPAKPWCDDPILLGKFVDILKRSPNVQYIHFIGGETLITPAFQKILTALIDTGLSDKLTIGFTTNLTVMDTEIVDLLTKFYQINLGVSIECLDNANDYIRFGGRIDQTKLFLDRWVKIGKDRGWSIQIRTTPTILSISRLIPLYEYAWQNHLMIESCNFIDEPAFMRPAVLPADYRLKIQDELRSWIKQKNQLIHDEQVINTRNPDFVQQQILQDLRSYINYLGNEPDQSSLLPKLVKYLRMLESLRENCVLDFLPEYEDLFRSAGY